MHPVHGVVARALQRGLVAILTGDTPSCRCGFAPDFIFISPIPDGREGATMLAAHRSGHANVIWRDWSTAGVMQPQVHSEPIPSPAKLARAPYVSAGDLRRFTGSPRDYLEATTYDGRRLPVDSLLSIREDSLVPFDGQGIALMTAYRTFPFPTLSRTQQRLLETAADTVLRARMHLLETTLADLYRAMPTPLSDSHRTLDATVEVLLGVPREIPDGQLAQALYDRHLTARGA